MSVTFTRSGIETFTVLHARYLASKVATDLQRFQRFYGSPSDLHINSYEAELVHLLSEDVVETVVYGFKRQERWTEAAVRYRAVPGGVLVTNDDPGKIRPGIDITGAHFASFLEYNAKWWAHSTTKRESIRAQLPFVRGSGDVPSLERGYWTDDLTYTAGGRSLGRSSVRQ